MDPHINSDTGFTLVFPQQDDEFTHLYTLIVRSDNTYTVKIDNKKEREGKLEDDWDFLPPQKIPDPEAKKPEDWDDRAKIDDPDEVKPEVGERLDVWLLTVLLFVI